jgi:uncharacterized protein (DUF2141 family)
MKTLVRVLLLVTFLVVGHVAQAAELAVTVTGISQAQGVIRVVVIMDPNGNAHQAQSRNVDVSTAKDGALTVSFMGMAPGLYAVVALEDKKVNHAMERAVTGAVGAPVSSTSEVRVTLAEPKTAVSIPLAPTR